MFIDFEREECREGRREEEEEEEEEEGDTDTEMRETSM